MSSFLQNQLSWHYASPKKLPPRRNVSPKTMPSLQTGVAFLVAYFTTRKRNAECHALYRKLHVADF
jgi:hypothetical protein